MGCCVALPQTAPACQVMHCVIQHPCPRSCILCAMWQHPTKHCLQQSGFRTAEVIMWLHNTPRQSCIVAVHEGKMHLVMFCTSKPWTALDARVFTQFYLLPDYPLGCYLCKSYKAGTVVAHSLVCSSRLLRGNGPTS